MNHYVKVEMAPLKSVWLSHQVVKIVTPHWFLRTKRWLTTLRLVVRFEPHAGTYKHFVWCVTYLVWSHTSHVVYALY